MDEAVLADEASVGHADRGRLPGDDLECLLVWTLLPLHALSSMPENDHAREYDNRNDDQADGKPLPALLLLAFVLCEIEFLIIKLVHLAAYYTKTDCKFFVRNTTPGLHRRI